MQMHVVLLMVSVLTSRLSHQSCPVILKNFQKLPLDDLVLSQDSLAQKIAVSRLDCGLRCGRAEGCVMYTFLPSQSGPRGECRIYGQLVSSTMAREPSSGARSYKVKVPLTCDSGYTLVCDRCLMFVNTLMNFTQAMDTCQALNQGHMAVISTLQDLDCVKPILRTQGSSNLMYLGADDLAERGSFVWHDCSTLALGSALWTSGQPNMNDGERCVCTNLHYSGLHDLHCYRLATVLCQKD